MTKPKRRRKRKPHVRVKTLATRKKQLAPVAAPSIITAPRGVIDVAKKDLLTVTTNLWSGGIPASNGEALYVLESADEIDIVDGFIRTYQASNDYYKYRPLNAVGDFQQGWVRHYAIVPNGATFDPNGGAGSRLVYVAFCSAKPPIYWAHATQSWSNVDDVVTEHDGMVVLVLGDQQYIFPAMDITTLESQPMP